MYSKCWWSCSQSLIQQEQNGALQQQKETAPLAGCTYSWYVSFIVVAFHHTSKQLVVAA
jgi:hypothetical protein